MLQRSEPTNFCYVIFLFFYCSNLKNLLLQSSETLLQKIRKLNDVKTPKKKSTFFIGTYTDKKAVQ